MSLSQNYLKADVKADLYSQLLSGFTCSLLGESVIGDIPIRWYDGDGASTATDDGENVIQPTGLVTGRWIKRLTQQQHSDWNASSGQTVVDNKPSLLQQSYEATTKRSSSFPVFLSATVSSGLAVFQLTTNGMSGGTAIFLNGVIQDSINLTVNDATAAYQMSWAFSNSNKTLTVTANKLTTANILTGVLGQGQANTASIKLQIWGY